MRARVWIRGPGALLASVLVHAVGLGSGAWLLSRSFSQGAPTRAAPLTVEITLAGSTMDLPPMSRASLAASADPRAQAEPEPPAAGGGDHEPHPDMQRAGRGGSDVANMRALNLADSDDGLTLDRDPMNRLDRSQVQRLRTAARRATHDDRRATPHPMELSFLATGRGRTASRRPEARFDPSRGSLTGRLPADRGSAVGGDEVEDGRGPEPEPGGVRDGRDARARAAGIPRGAPGHDFRQSASVMLARPWVPRARAAVPAPARGRPNDTVDSSQEVASAVRSLVHASTAGGRSGAGPGGENAPGLPGSGGARGPGSRATAAGYGPGAIRDPGADPRATGYFRSIQRKVRPYWRDAFPEWAIGAGRGGVTVVGFTVSGDGGVTGIHVVRSSGIAEFDRKVMAALSVAAPFGPLPAVLGHGPLALRIAFDATNPPVGRDGPGNGRRR